MGVDFYTCAVCGNNFPDCGDFYSCEFCCNHFCSRRCADLKLIEVDEVAENDESEDSYKEEFDCCICRKDEANDYILFNVLLRHYKITREDVMKIWKEEGKDDGE